MGDFAIGGAHNEWNRNSGKRCKTIVGRKQYAHPIGPFIVREATGIAAVVVMRGHRSRGVNPHRKQGKPG